MQVKVPVCYDVSHHKEIPNFKLVSPKPVLFITKATEAHPGTIYNHTDDKFVGFFEGFQSIGCRRGAYHFFRKSYDARRQAEHFVNVISKVDILPTDILILDVEEGGERAWQLWAWFEYVRKAYPDNMLMLYSTKRLLDPIVMTEAEKTYFRKIPTWPAGYPYFPDLFSRIPSSYTPDQTKYGKPYLWQYSCSAIIQGIVGEVDLNWINPEFYELIKDSTIGESTMADYTGKAIQDAKVWATVGGQQVNTIKTGTSIRADQEVIVSGVKYLRLTSPYFGWSKAQWFLYSITTTPPPPPPPPPPEPTVTLKHTIKIYTDGSYQVDDGAIIP